MKTNLKRRTLIGPTDHMTGHMILNVVNFDGAIEISSAWHYHDN